jgi:hypothetical protein
MKWGLSALHYPSQQSPQGCRILGCMGVIVIIEIDPCALRSTVFDPVGPHRQLFLRVVVPVPAFWTMQALSAVGGPT